MVSTARLRYLQASPQKVRLVADMIRGKDVQEAANLLQVTKKHAARPMEKLLRSAIANAENRDEMVDVDALYVKEIYVDPGPTIKRIRPRAQGRAYRILKRQSHITIKLDSRRESAAEAAAE
ncbi:MAG: 50S ribosomal protein L22 [Acidobacteria bacterium]|nr:MAG: 50S ribosomal protein L22 [Acidobacteriota bacterium]REK07132.1 MAG: 50S ribosomal protein L22 [Acidobacteriota bacterium]